MSVQEVKRPEPGTLDWASSVAHGWDPNSGEEPTYSFGYLTKDSNEFVQKFQKLIDTVSRSNHSYLLDPIQNLKEPKNFPEVSNPIAENLVVIDATVSNETGLVPLCALWQSGWQAAQPYIIVRQSVLERLILAAGQLRTFDPEMYLCITDGWRSIEQQRDLYNAFYPNGHIQGELLYVSKPQIEDRFAAPHPSGGAVDVMIGYQGNAISIGSDLDYMDEQANSGFFEKQTQTHLLERDLRRFFSNLLAKYGFVPIDSEWWHVEFGTRRWAGKTGNEPLYGNATVEESMYDGYEPVKAVAGSKRMKIQALEN